ncbi:hypothetical protein SDC9_182728 [bioreactor metagenome]|uniref:Uncharacterized protein n=1 Tax=bioreactor metagenome TaxID=1076179 RepID=A0A645H872_9ZZZZ
MPYFDPLNILFVGENIQHPLLQRGGDHHHHRQECQHQNILGIILPDDIDQHHADHHNA